MGVTVVGSFVDDGAFDKVRVSAMMRDTTNDSINKIQALVRKFTPVGLDHTVGEVVHPPGHLKESVDTKGPRRIAKNVWQGEVFSDVEYAAAIEYGMPRKPLTAKGGGRLAFFAGGRLIVVPAAPKWGGYDGAHMFQKGAALFEKDFAEPIARKNAAQWLGAVDAGRSVAVI